VSANKLVLNHCENKLFVKSSHGQTHTNKNIHTCVFVCVRQRELMLHERN